MKPLGWIATLMIAIGLLPATMFLIGYSLTLVKDCEGMRLEGPGPCMLEAGLMGSRFLNAFTLPLLVAGLCLAILWIVLRQRQAKALGKSRTRP